MAILEDQLKSDLLNDDLSSEIKNFINRVLIY